MELTGNSREIADFILARFKEAEGHLRKEEIDQMLIDEYGWDTDAPDIVLGSLIDDYAFITRQGAVLRLTQEGDKAAKKGIRIYEKKRKFMERTVSMKVLLEVIAALATIIGVLVTLLIAG